MTGKDKQVREQVVVYLDERDAALLDELTEQTGLAKTEVFRRGLRRFAQETMSGDRPGSSIAHLIATAADDGYPPDVAARADDYLYGGGYDKRAKGRGKKRARSR
ncbi:hypothetical protein BH23GEM10_BH23GEM10_07590 [soil metagenome]